jgi:hypothetical protein
MCRIAELHSAELPALERPITSRNQPIPNRRYGKLQICVTGTVSTASFAQTLIANTIHPFIPVLWLRRSRGGSIRVHSWFQMHRYG